MLQSASRCNFTPAVGKVFRTIVPGHRVDLT